MAGDLFSRRVLQHSEHIKWPESVKGVIEKLLEEKYGKTDRIC
jgi:bacterioferritin (cytochrome b1)